MYVVNTILVGVDQESQPAVRKVLARLDVNIEADFSTANELLLERKRFQDRQLLILVQVQESQQTEQVQLLRDTYSSWPIIALMKENTSPNEVLAINRAGADQIVTVPVHEDDLESALELLSKRFQTHSSLSTVIAVAGTVAGCGVSTISLNLADLIAHSHRKHTLLVETAQQMATQAISLNMQPQSTVADLLVDSNTIDVAQLKRAMLHVDARFDLLSGPMDISAGGANSVKGMPKLVQVAREVADVVVIDVVAMFDDLHFETLWASDQVVLVLEQTIPSIRSASMMKDALLRARPPKKLHYVLNKYDPEMDSYTTGKIMETLQIRQLLTIPHDRKHVLRSSAEGKPLRVLDSELPIVKSIRELANATMGLSPQSDGSSSTFLHRLARFLQS